MIHETFTLREGRDPACVMSTYVLYDPMKKDDPSREEIKRPAVLICPGGGYGFCSAREAEPIAIQYNAAGFHAFVIDHYSVHPYRYPDALEEVSKAMQIIRENAEKWCVNKDQIAVCGFSAGGHLACSLGVFWNQEPIKTADQSNRPNAMILGYPVISSDPAVAHMGSFDSLCGEDNLELKQKMSLENQVTKDTPPAFLWHTYTDEVVPVENSLRFAAALRKENIPFEMHIYQDGPHGLSTNLPDVNAYYPELNCSRALGGWVALSADWMRDLFHIR